MKSKFTREVITPLPLPEGKAAFTWWDQATPRFGHRLRHSGTASWVGEDRNIDGLTRKARLDGTVGLDAAREWGRERLAQAALGRDPQAEREAARASAKRTFGRIVEQYLDIRDPAKGLFVTKRHNEPLRPATYNADKRYLLQHWRALHNLPVRAIKLADVAGALNDIRRRHGLSSAEHAREVLSGFFAWAMRQGVCEANPVILVEHPQPSQKPRSRVLKPEEIRAIWATCRDDDFGRIVKLLFFTGCRIGEIGGLKWGEIDLETDTITLPGERTKNHQELFLPLPRASMDIIRSTPQRNGRGFLFGNHGGAFSRWSWEKLQFDKRLIEAGHKLPAWTLHDIRRTVTTLMETSPEDGGAGILPHIADICLGDLPHDAPQSPQHAHPRAL